MSDKLNKCVFVLVIVFIIALILLTSISPSMNSNSKNKQIVFNLTEDNDKTNKIEHKTEADDSKRFPHYFNFSTDIINNNKSHYSEENPIISNDDISINTELKPIIENKAIDRSLGKPIIGSNLISDTVIIGGKQNYPMNRQMSEVIPVYSEGTKLVSDILRSGPWYGSDTEIDDRENSTQLTSEPTDQLNVDLNFDMNVTKSNLSVIPFSFRALLNKKPMSLPLIETKSNNKRNIVNVLPVIKEKIFDSNSENKIMNRDSENNDNYVKPALTVTRQSFKSQIRPLYYNKHFTTKHSYNKNFFTANKYSNPTAKYYKNFSERSDYFSDGDESFAPKPLLSVKEVEEYSSVVKTPQTTQITRSSNDEQNDWNRDERKVDDRPVEDLKQIYFSKVRRIQEENSRLKNANNKKLRFQEYSPHLYRNSRHYSTSNPRRLSADIDNDNSDDNFRDKSRGDYQTTTTTKPDYNSDAQTYRFRSRIPKPEYDDYNPNTNNRQQDYRSVYTRPIGESLVHKPYNDRPLKAAHYDDNDYESEKQDENIEEPEEFEHPKQFYSTSTGRTQSESDYPSKPKPFIQFTPYKPFEPFKPSLLFPYKHTQNPASNYRVIVDTPRNRVRTTALHASPSNIPPEIITSSQSQTLSDHKAVKSWKTVKPTKQYTATPKIRLSSRTTPKPNVNNNVQNNTIASMPTITAVTYNQQMNRVLNDRIRRLFFPRTELLSEYHTLIIPMRITYPTNITTNAERMAVERILSRD